MSDTWTRRRALLGTGAVITGTVGSIVVASNNATAQVSGSLDVGDASVRLVDQQLQDILVDVATEWRYESNVDLDTVETEVHMGQRASSVDLIARETTDVSGTNTSPNSGQTTLSGSVAQANDFVIADMVPASGKIDHTGIAELRVFLVKDGSVVAETAVTDTFTITISKESQSVSVEVGGSGTITFKTTD